MCDHDAFLREWIQRSRMLTALADVKKSHENEIFLLLCLYKIKTSKFWKFFLLFVFDYFLKPRETMSLK